MQPIIPTVVPDRIVFDDEGKTITGVSPRRARELEAHGDYPRSRRVSKRRNGRLLSELVEWVRARPLAPLPQPRRAADQYDDDHPRDHSTTSPASLPPRAGQRMR